MIRDKGIFIKNVYYMLAYAFRVLSQKNYEDVASEEFEQIQDLFAAILYKGISRQLKQGLHREYIGKNQELPMLRGKLDIGNTIKSRIRNKRVLACEYDELSVNNMFNRILKTTASILATDSGVKKEYRDDLKKVLLFFDKVDVIGISQIRWDALRYERNNKNYEMLMNICYFVLEGMIQTTDKGTYKVAAFSDEHMHRLYERVILEYFKRHHPYLAEARAAWVKWNLAPETDESMIPFLPIMQTDVFLRYEEKILIIDAKYYGHAMQTRYEKTQLRSWHLYQIYTYVKNQDAAGTGSVSGMLLYAKTEEEITPDFTFTMGGNRISARTLDLNKEFSLIKAQLDEIAREHFGQLP